LGARSWPRLQGGPDQVALSDLGETLSSLRLCHEAAERAMERSLSERGQLTPLLCDRAVRRWRCSTASSGCARHGRRGGRPCEWSASVLMPWGEAVRAP